MIAVVCALALQSAGFAPVIPAVKPFELRTSGGVVYGRVTTPPAPVVMILPKGDKPEVQASDEALNKTKSRLLIVWAFIGAIGFLVTSSGKTLSLDNAPGAKEAAAKKAADSKAYLEQQQARVDAVAARAAAIRASGETPSAPPKPWERKLPGGL
jgi:hypothetical protein